MTYHLLNHDDNLGRFTMRRPAGRILAALTLLMSVGAAQADVMLEDMDGTAGFAVHGVVSTIRAGNDVSSVGDVNGDGFDDFVVGHQYRMVNDPPGYDEVYLIFGTGADRPPVFGASTVDGTNGVKILGYQNNRTQFGISVAGAGDVNDDGYNDFIIGAPLAPKAGSSINTVSGQAYLVYGRETWPQTVLSSLLFSTSGVMINGETANDHAGIKVAGAGDVNGDGFADFIVQRQHQNGPFYNIKTYVVFGNTQVGGSGFSWLELSSINGQNGFAILGTPYLPTTEMPLSVAGAGDINGDGYDDIVIGGTRGVPFMDSFGYVIFGKASFAAQVEPSILGGSAGFRFNVPYSNSQHPLQVASAGDVNGDGYADIMVGPGDSSVTGVPPDQIYVIFGKSAWPTPIINLPGYLNGDTGVTLKGEIANMVSWPYTALASAGDVNGDGYSDLLIGSWLLGPYMYGGETHLLFGKASWPATEIIPKALDAEAGQKYHARNNAYSGYSVSGGGDINNDGFMDFLIGAPVSSSNGKAHIVYGSGEVAGSATYKSRTASGNRSKSAVGIPGDPGDGTSPSRVWLDFDAGSQPSLETATITRSNAGLSGFARPEEVANVTWQISSTRQNWGSVEVTLKYTDSEIAELPGSESELCVYAAPASSGPWTKLATSNDINRNQVAFSVPNGQLGHYTIGAQTAMEASVDEWSLY